MNMTSHHPIIYTAPSLSREDDAVLDEIHQMRKDLRYVLRTPTSLAGLTGRSRE